MGVGKRIVERRKELNVSQYALAKKAGISQSGLSTIENEKNGATATTLQSIADALGCSVTYLMDGINDSKEKAPTVSDDGLDAELVNLLVDLSPSEVQRVLDFVAGLKAARAEDASHQG